MPDDGHLEQVLRHSKALRSEAGALVQEVRGMGFDLRNALDLKRRMEERPWSTMAVAAGVGYLLGGGLFTPLTGRMVRLGTRVLLLPILRAQLEAMVQGAAAPPAPGFEGSEDGAGGM